MDLSLDDIIQQKRVIGGARGRNRGGFGGRGRGRGKTNSLRNVRRSNGISKNSGGLVSMN